MNKKLIKEADALLHSLDCGVINTNALRSFLNRVKKGKAANTSATMKDREKHYIMMLDKRVQRKAV